MAKQVKTVSMEESLWQSCNKMRGSIEPSEYKHVVLSLMFLKYAGDHFEKRRQEIIAVCRLATRSDRKAELKMDLVLVLADNGYPPYTKDEVFKEILEQAENFKRHQIKN